jgi:hypothetical protein
MYDSSLAGTPSIMSVAGLLASMENMGGVPSSVTAVAAGLQGTQLFYDEDLFSGHTPMKNEKQVGLGTLGLSGGYQGSFIGASLSGEC